MAKVVFNVDYEYQLFEGHPRPHIRGLLEYLYLWLGDDVLLSSESYSNEYLDYIESFKKCRPEIQKIKSFQNHQYWWGSLEPRELMKKINSKRYASELSHRLDPEMDNFFYSKEELKAYDPQISQFYLVKSNYGFSGRGHKLIRDRIDFENLKEQNIVIENLKNRYKDIGVYFIGKEKKIIFYTNFVDSKFQYKGSSIGDGSIESLNLNQEESLLMKKYLPIYDDVFKLIQKEGYLDGFSVDAFYFLDKNEDVKFKFLVEINARKTMGYINYLFRERYKLLWSTLWRVSDIDVIKAHFLSTECFFLSPPGNKNQWIILKGETFERHQAQLKLLYSL